MLSIECSDPADSSAPVWTWISLKTYWSWPWPGTLNNLIFLLVVSNSGWWPTKKFHMFFKNFNYFNFFFNFFNSYIWLFISYSGLIFQTYLYTCIVFIYLEKKQINVSIFVFETFKRTASSPFILVYRNKYMGLLCLFAIRRNVRYAVMFYRQRLKKTNYMFY